MKATAQKQPAGFSPVKLELTFETAEELYSFQLRMAGYLSGVDTLYQHSISNCQYQANFGPNLIEPTYSSQLKESKKVDFRLLCDADHYVASKVNDVLNKLEK